METNFFFVGIQRRRLAAKVQPEEARFGPELDWGKLWRGQVFGELEPNRLSQLVFGLLSISWKSIDFLKIDLCLGCGK